MTLLAADDDRALVDGAVPEGLTVAFGDEAADADVRFASAGRAARTGGGAGGDAARTGELTVAPQGDGLWRRAPWPAADALFDLAPPADGAAALVVGADEAPRAALCEKLAAHGLSPAHAPRLLLAELTGAAIVVFADDDGFPALVPAACAAGRLVILRCPAPLFGWEDGVDCFVADGDRAVVLAQTAARAPRAFDVVRAMGRLTARAHRASDVYERLALDLSLGVGRGGAAQRRSSA
jgi:hypothetical protein